ncbi:MAG: transposase [Patescibacteria group bacterium]
MDSKGKIIIINLMAYEKKLNSQTKFQIVLETISGQKSHPEIARTYGIHPQLITNWKKVGFFKEFFRISKIFSSGRAVGILLVILLPADSGGYLCLRILLIISI